MSYQRVLNILKSLPEKDRVLAAGVYVFSGRGSDCGCAIGKVMPSLHNNAKEVRRNTTDIRSLFTQAKMFSVQKTNGRGYFGRRSEKTLKLLRGILRDTKRLDITCDQLVTLQTQNDECCGSFSNSLDMRKRRYELVVQWLQQQVYWERQGY